MNLPNTLQVHRADLDNMSHFFGLENTISSAAGHACNIQKLGPIDEVII